MGTSFVRLCAALALLAACSTPDVQPEHLKYMVMFDGDGVPVDPLDDWAGYYFKYEPLSEDEDEAEAKYEDWVAEIVRGIEASGQDRVLVFIHGGLNEQPETLQRVIDLHPEILEDGSYPIFVNWQSNLVSSYRDHLLFIRRGQNHHWWGLPLAPFYLVADVASGLFTLPMVIWSQANQVAEVADLAKYPVRKQAEDATERLAVAHQGGQPDPLGERMPIAPPDLESEFDFHWPRFWATLVAKPVSLLVVQSAGSGSWDIMQGRIDLLFRRESDLAGDTSQREPHGLLYLMQALHDLQQRRREAGGRLEVDLVGHSMGTIVANHLLGFSQLAQLDGGTAEDRRVKARLPTFSHVVYLAAACSIRSWQENVFPYLLHETETRFFHVLLDPDLELAEWNAEDLAPRGSLLTWIDDFLARPTAHLDRTAGRYDNLMVTLYDTPLSIRDRVHVWVLPRAGNDYPQRHGDFTDPAATEWHYRFWRPGAWWPWWDEQGRPLPADPAAATAPVTGRSDATHSPERRGT